jgi:hypothetical protein
MPNNELEELSYLAVLCDKIAENASYDTGTREQARQLTREWVALVARETPPPPELRVYEQIQAEKRNLTNRMRDFLGM